MAAVSGEMFLILSKLSYPFICFLAGGIFLFHCLLMFFVRFSHWVVLPSAGLVYTCSLYILDSAALFQEPTFPSGRRSLSSKPSSGKMTGSRSN